MNRPEMAYRFVWRASRNVLCALPIGRRWLYPSSVLATKFGRGDADYAWRVFLSHLDRLHRVGFTHANRVLEVGPGRNLGTALLWWAWLKAAGSSDVRVVAWDVFPNVADPCVDYWRTTASELLAKFPESSESLAGAGGKEMRTLLVETARAGSPAIEYQVCPLADFTRLTDMKSFELVYSQAVIEHIWYIDEFWESSALVTAKDGWHSHRIDLADHGRRATNYLEMCQWSALSYWLTQRYTPGAINRWRASEHIRKLESLGFAILLRQCDLQDELPVPRHLLAKAFRDHDARDLRTTGLDVVARSSA